MSTPYPDTKRTQRHLLWGLITPRPPRVLCLENYIIFVPLTSGRIDVRAYCVLCCFLDNGCFRGTGAEDATELLSALLVLRIIGFCYVFCQGICVKALSPLLLGSTASCNSVLE